VNDGVARFEAAVQAGLDPKNADAVTEAVTTTDCDWVGLVCPQCRHKFRRDDPVKLDVDADGRPTVRHLDPDLGCVNSRALPPTGEAVLRLLAAVRAEDPIDADVRVLRLEPGDELLGDDPRRPCRRCRFPLRPYESVVVCPCGRGCSAAIHYDLDRGLLCYERWKNSLKTAHCLLTKQELGSR